ncbi:uncharacterized protein LOC143278016 [Babylonia areolata]|uniref:uncharacterized protein LOC143278016 n=1 Tax=Babylonia areolata TaxID=304850 RepID=UPI003FD46FC2
MTLRKCGVFFCSLLLAAPVLSMLPAPVPPELQTQPPPPQPQPQQPQLRTGTTGGQTGPQPLEFDFKGFFDYFIKIYGPDALLVFQQKLNERKTLEGMSSVNVPGDPIPCGLAKSYNGAGLTYDNPNRIHGSTATYKCEVGFKGPEAIIMCISGVWSDPKVPVACEVVTCGPPTRMMHGHASPTRGQYGDTATYTCDPGFQADNIASPSKCQADGTWTPPSFSCTNMMADHQRMTQMAQMRGMMSQMPGMTGPMGGAMNAMMQQAMASAGGAGGMPGAAGGMFGAGAVPGAGGPGGQLNSAMMGAIAQAMGQGAAGGMAGGKPGAPGGMGGMMSSMMAMMASGQSGGPPNPQGSLPPHLVGLGKMAPMLMPQMMGGSMASPMGGPGMPGGAGMMGGKPLEPEEQAMMAMMLHNMQEQNRRRQAQKRQQLRQRQLQLQQEQRQRELQQQKNSGINISELLAKNAAGGGGGGTQTSPKNAGGGGGGATQGSNSRVRGYKETPA